MDGRDLGAAERGLRGSPWSVIDIVGRGWPESARKRYHGQGQGLPLFPARPAFLLSRVSKSRPGAPRGFESLN